MKKIIRSIAAAAAVYILMFIVNRAFSIDIWWLPIIISIVCVYLIVYTCRSYRIENYETTQEYILNLHNDTIGEVFNKSKYPNYKKESVSKDGNDYISSDGGVICTKYVTKKLTKRVHDGVVLNHVFCVAVIGLILITWYAVVRTGQTGDAFRTHLSRVGGNFRFIRYYGLEALGQSLSDQFKTIHNGLTELVLRIYHNVSQLISDIKGRI